MDNIDHAARTIAVQAATDQETAKLDQMMPIERAAYLAVKFGCLQSTPDDELPLPSSS